PETVKNPFYSMAPEWFLIPLVLLATMATVIASQALITGAFSVTKQVIQLGYLPRMQIIHTSIKDTGQIYMPMINWGLFCAIVLAVALFKSSSNLAAAYGIAVTLDMLITTFLTFFVIRYSWNYPLGLCILATSFFFLIDLAFFSSNLLKLTEGGWFPLVIGATVYLLMRTWNDGRRLLNKVLTEKSIPLQFFLDSLGANPPKRVTGTAVFMTAQKGTVPSAFLHNLKHNKVLHQYNLFVTVRNHEVPWVGLDDRIEISPLGHDAWQIIVNYGFKNDPDLPRALEPIRMRGVEFEPMSTSYFLSRDIIIPTIGGGMAQWREKIFAQMHLNASAAAEFLRLPTGSVVELGSKVEI
ncbi:MAG: potassium transporter Kup, partial [Betaproteobacteria bacterium]|nr:potassium transporter Kup [Betaproteobacteria bacterium]